MKDSYLILRVSSDERAAMHRIAASRGTTVSELVREYFARLERIERAKKRARGGRSR